MIGTILVVMMIVPVMNTKKYVIVLLGPTGVGKTDLSINIAIHFGASIVSSDSRQVYKDMYIGTAVPTKEQLLKVPHYFIQSEDLEFNFTAGRYEKEALKVISQLHQKSDFVVVAGGSAMYIDALCDGIDDIAPASPLLRDELREKVKQYGIEPLVEQLRELDAEYAEIVDVSNPNRVIRALEVCISTGKKYSEMRTGIKKKRDFEIIKIGLTRPREELYNRINLRVDMMIKEGLEEEARALYPKRELNSLQTVGYREFFDYFDGTISFDAAVELLKRNSRRYAKRQMTWFNRDENIMWFSPNESHRIIDIIEAFLKCPPLEPTLNMQK